MTALYERLLEERHQPVPERTPEQVQHDRMQELIGLIAEALDQPTRRERGKPITTREVREARRLRHQGLTWREVAERMGTNPARARQAAQKITTLKESA